MRYTQRYRVENNSDLKQQLSHWVNQFEVACILDSNKYTADTNQQFEFAIAVNPVHELRCEAGTAFEQLKTFYNTHKDWLFGFLTYDLKNEVEKLRSSNSDGIDMPPLYFFVPKWVIFIQGDELLIHSTENDCEQVYQQLLDYEELPDTHHADINLTPRISKADYLETIDQIRDHISKGDVYELNFCQEFFGENVSIDPISCYVQLNEQLKAPFSTYFKLADKHLLCMSPERFMQKRGSKLISEPIKGTIRKGTTPNENELLRAQLANSKKDQAENVMIVDLVRNDLSRSCEAGTVKVEQLFDIRTYETLHHMVSTVSGELREGVHFVDALKKAFPMGSMTGAPKVIAMELIEQYEQSQRGLYSGSVGYISPEGDFDFNVVIRSLLYNAVSQYLSCQVGGAIVYDSVPEQEYDECQVKVGRIMEVLAGERAENLPSKMSAH